MGRPRTIRARSAMTAIGITTVLALPGGLALAGCSQSSSDSSGPTTTGEGGTTTTTEAPTTTVEGRPVDDVDISPADFGDPTSVTNPLYPVSDVAYVVMLGEDEGEPLRVEVTLLPDTRSIDWQDGSTDVVQSQFLALTDGELVEIADDYFAQDDSGNVWYFGEDVSNYEEGRVADRDGSWLAGADGPPGMIMPADPQVGDVYHPENIPGLVYEEDLVLSVDQTLDGPSGPIEGAIEVQETVDDGSIELKNWAPGYGEFRALVPDVEDVVVVFALPNDAADQPVPDDLTALLDGAASAFDQATATEPDLDGLATTVDDLTAALTAYDDSGETDHLPDAFGEALQDAVDELSAAVDDGDADVAAAAAVDVELAALDAQMTYGELPDLERIGALGRRLRLEVDAGDEAEAANTAAIIAALWDRSSQRYPEATVVAAAVEQVDPAAEPDLDQLATLADALVPRDG